MQILHYMHLRSNKNSAIIKFSAFDQKIIYFHIIRFKVKVTDTYIRRKKKFDYLLWKIPQARQHQDNTPILPNQKDFIIKINLIIKLIKN